MKVAEKGDPGLMLARRMSSLIGRLLRRGATSYRAYSGVELSGLMLAARLASGFATGIEGPDEMFSYAKYE